MEAWPEDGLEGQRDSPKPRSTKTLERRKFQSNKKALATWCENLTHWERPWRWERLKAMGEGGGRGWDGWRTSLTQCTWIWGNSRRQWRTEEPGMLQPMGSQTVRDNLAAEQHKDPEKPHSSRWESMGHFKPPSKKYEEVKWILLSFLSMGYFCSAIQLERNREAAPQISPWKLYFQRIIFNFVESDKGTVYLFFLKWDKMMWCVE